MRKFITSFAVALVIVLTSGAVMAQEVTLRVHHFLSQRAPLHANFLVPFAEQVAKASNGRIKIEIFASMSRGGTPPGLYERAVEGADEIVLTVPGYTAGRFNQSEVFELPFIMEDSIATSKAFWDLTERTLQDGEFEDVKVLAAWVHGPGLIHSADPIRRLEDLRGMELRGPTRVVTDALGELGASPVGMPLPKIPENISKGVISGATLPWEVVPAIKLGELVKNHTEFGGPRAFYTTTFVLAMNWDAYESMPSDLRRILDRQTGKSLSVSAARAMANADIGGRKVYANNNIIRLSEREVGRWIKAVEPVYDRWVARARTKGFNGNAAIAQAKRLIAANQ